MALTTLQNGRYKIKKELGRGSFGITYLADDTKMSREVAIKEFFPSHLARRRTQTNELIALSSSDKDFEAYKRKFLKEVTALTKFTHPNIVRVYDSFEENNTIYYTMEHLNGVNLWDYIEAKGSLDEKEILKIIAPILDALEVIHKTDEMLHRDLKPDNIMLADNGDRVIIIDFGLVKYGFKESKKSSFAGLGNPHFSPVEQFCESCKKGAFTDIYTLCSTIYMMATGEPPIELNARTNGEKLPDISSRYSERFRIAVYKGMELRGVNRWQGIKELRDELFKEKSRNKLLWLFIVLVTGASGIFVVNELKSVSVDENNTTEPIVIENNETDVNTSDEANLSSTEELTSKIIKYTEAIKTYPNDASAYYNRGNAYSKLGDATNAIIDYRQITKLDANDSWSYNRLGLSYYKLKEYDLAFNSFNKSIELDASSNSAYINLFEMSIVINQDFDKSLEDKLIEFSQENKLISCEYEMLKIVQSISTNKPYNLTPKEWDEKYKDIELDWDWSDLEEWVSNTEDKEMKAKLQDAIKIFKTHI